MGTLDAQATAYATAFKTSGHGGFRGYTSAAKAHNNRPCLLVAPPTLDWSQAVLSGEGIGVTWRLLLLSSHEAGSDEALAELLPLLARAADVFDLERAEPVQYPMTPGGKRIAAYAATTTDLLDSL